MALFSGGTAAVVWGFYPSVWSSSNLGSSSGNTKAQGQVSQSGQSETNSSNHPTVNYFSPNYLTFVAGSTLSGTEFGATTGIVLGGIGISGEQTPLEAAGATIYNVGKYGIVPMAAFSAGTAFAVGALYPSVWSSSNLGSSSGNTTSTGKSLQSQSGISEGATSKSSLINTAGEYLIFVSGSTLDGGEFCGCIMNEDRLYNICIAVCIWTRRSTERQNKHKYNILLV